jgi:hypothetical protein
MLSHKASNAVAAAQQQQQQHWVQLSCSHAWLMLNC